MPVEQRAEQLANRLAQVIRKALSGLNPTDRLHYLNALGGLSHVLVAEDMEARQQLGLLNEVTQDGPPW